MGTFCHRHMTKHGLAETGHLQACLGWNMHKLINVRFVVSYLGAPFALLAIVSVPCPCLDLAVLELQIQDDCAH